jgi:hypothetical protein
MTKMKTWQKRNLSESKALQWLCAQSHGLGSLWTGPEEYPGVTPSSDLQRELGEGSRSWSCFWHTFWSVTPLPPQIGQWGQAEVHLDRDTSSLCWHMTGLSENECFE